MSVIKKPDLKIFAQDAKTGEIETFPDVLRGWGVTLERTAGKPPLEWFNAIGKRVDEWLMYLTQRGLAEWDGSVDYPKDALVQHSSVFYVALKVTKGEQPNTSQNAWKPLVDFLGVNNKLDKTAVVQSTGTSTTSVMSQKASTDAFQPKGTYPTTSEMNVELNKKIDKANISQQLANDVNKVPSLDLVTKELGKKQPTGDYATSTALKNGLEGKLDKSSVVQSTGSSTTSVMSQKASTDAFQPKGIYPTVSEMNTALDKKQPVGNYALKGDSYTKAEESNLLDGKLDKSGGEVGALTVTTNGYGRNIQLKRSDSKTDSPQPEIISFHHGDGTRRGYVGYGGFSNTLTISNEENSSINIESSWLYFNGNRVLTESDVIVPHPIPWSLPTAPSGYLICQGQTFNKATYPKLAIAYPSGRLPDLRSEFIRGADAGRGIDTGREVLSSQSGNSLLSARGMGGNSEFSLKMSAGSVGTDNQGQREIYQQIEGQNGNETRPRNIAFLYIVRAA
ncbi:phage tail protein [Proteus sp. G2660]|uniref:phage tail protein n=1 Tax=Proteus sp. G2660 TaxID=2698873 RepID=UPI001377DF6E|nr:phage tail protein [Proteus sp. G2660]NBM97320.1 histidine kinase [Proteus sp. G2660]